MKFLGSTHPVQVQNFLAQDGILGKKLIELAELKEENLLVVVLLECPELLHAGSETFPVVLLDQESGRVIVGTVWSVSIFILQVGGLKEVRQSFMNLIDTIEATTYNFVLNVHLCLTTLLALLLYYWG